MDLVESETRGGADGNVVRKFYIYEGVGDHECFRARQRPLPAFRPSSVLHVPYNRCGLSVRSWGELVKPLEAETRCANTRSRSGGRCPRGCCAGTFGGR